MRTGAAPSVPGSFLQSGEVFLQEHFVLAVLYVQLRACPVGVYGRAFPDFRKMFRAATKAAVLRSTGKTGTGVFPVSKNCCARKMGNVPSVPALLSENGERPVCPRFIVGKWGTSRLSPLYCRPRFIVVVPALLSSPLYCPVPALLSPALLSPLYSPSAESVKRLREMRTVLAQSTSIVEASRFHPRRMTLWPRRRATDRFVQERLHSPGLVSHCPYS